MSDCGHGHVVPRADGVKARCGGPALCSECAADLKLKGAQLTFPEACRRLGMGYPLPHPLTPEGEAWINKQLE
jgi:hypothetical protein